MNGLKVMKVFPFFIASLVAKSMALLVLLPYMVICCRNSSIYML